MLLVDKTGPVQVIVWGELASKITDHWNVLQAARASSTQSDVPHIVDFQKVRVFPLVKSDYNGESITRIRTLRTMENTGDPINATTMCFKTTFVETGWTTVTTNQLTTPGHGRGRIE